jgi:hypothetical protein
VERIVLGIGMSVVAFIIERRLIKAIKSGGLSTKPAREPEGGTAGLGAAPEGPHERAGLAAPPEQVHH